MIKSDHVFLYKMPAAGLRVFCLIQLRLGQRCARQKRGARQCSIECYTYFRLADTIHMRLKSPTVTTYFNSQGKSSDVPHTATAEIKRTWCAGYSLHHRTA